MEIFLAHWLSISAAIFILCMVLYGHYRGFVHIAVAVSALVVSILAARIFTPYVTSFLKENTQIQRILQETFANSISHKEESSEQEFSEETAPAYERAFIEQMKLPKQVKEILLENNNSDFYDLLGAETFFGYIASYLADIVLNSIAAVVLFLLVFFGLRILIGVLDVMARLPVISGINQIAGAVIGGICGLFWLWAGCMAADLCSGMGWALAVLEQIHGSLWLEFLYQNNLLGWVFISIIRKFV